MEILSSELLEQIKHSQKHILINSGTELKYHRLYEKTYGRMCGSEENTVHLDSNMNIISNGNYYNCCIKNNNPINCCIIDNANILRGFDLWKYIFHLNHNYYQNDYHAKYNKYDKFTSGKEIIEFTRYKNDLNKEFGMDYMSVLASITGLKSGNFASEVQILAAKAILLEQANLNTERNMLIYLINNSTLMESENYYSSVKRNNLDKLPARTPYETVRGDRLCNTCKEVKLLSEFSAGVYNCRTCEVKNKRGILRDTLGRQKILPQNIDFAKIDEEISRTKKSKQGIDEQIFLDILSENIQNLNNFIDRHKENVNSLNEQNKEKVRQLIYNIQKGI